MFISTPDYETLFQTQLVTDFISIRVVVSEIMSVLICISDVTDGFWFHAAVYLCGSESDHCYVLVFSRKFHRLVTC